MSNPELIHNSSLSADFSRLELAQEDLPSYEGHLCTKSRQRKINITGGSDSKVKETHPMDKTKLKEPINTQTSFLFFFFF